MNRENDIPERVNTVVIGGGVMGCSAAYFLASKSDREIALLEKDTIAAGSTGDSSANLRHHYSGDGKERYTKMAWWSHQFYRNFEAETGQQIAHVDNPRVRFGKENTREGEIVNEGYEVLQSMDIPSTKYLEEDLAEQYPMFANLDAFDFAISDDAAGFSDGSDAANGFARAAAELGASIFTGHPVTDVHVEDDTITGVSTDSGSIRCDEVLFAAGPWNAPLAEHVGVELPLTPTREQIIVLDPDEGYTERYSTRLPTTRLFGGDWYLRPDFGDGVLVATHYGTEACDPDAYKRTPDEEKILEAVDLLSETVPDLSDAGIKGQYCGVYSMTPDSDFLIDQVGPQGCYLVGGFSGHGFKHAPAVGEISSDLIIEGDTDFVDVGFFSLDRFDEHPDGHGRPEDHL